MTIEEFKAKESEFYRTYKEKSEGWEKKYIADAEKILTACQNPDNEMRESIGKFCNIIGGTLIMYAGDLETGVSYYHKALELCPDSFDIHWGYYTTLEEIVEDEDYATEELIKDAIDCLTFCIEYCTTPELKREHHVENRYIDLARVYIAAKQPEKAVECAKEALKIRKYDYAYEILAKAKSLMKKENFFVRVWKKVRAFFDKK